MFKNFYLAYALSNKTDYPMDELEKIWREIIVKDSSKLKEVKTPKYGDLIEYKDGSKAFYLVSTGDGYHRAYDGIGLETHKPDREIGTILRYE